MDFGFLTDNGVFLEKKKSENLTSQKKFFALTPPEKKFHDPPNRIFFDPPQTQKSLLTYELL